MEYGWLQSTGLETVGGGLNGDIKSYRKCVMQKISNRNNKNNFVISAKLTQ